MEMLSIEKELQGNAYPGRGIIIGKIASKGIEAIKSTQFLFCFKNLLLGLELYNSIIH